MRYYGNFYINTQKSDIFMLFVFKKKEFFFCKRLKTLKTGQVFTKASDIDLVRMIQVYNYICLTTMYLNISKISTTWFSLEN